MRDQILAAVSILFIGVFEGAVIFGLICLVVDLVEASRWGKWLGDLSTFTAVILATFSGSLKARRLRMAHTPRYADPEPLVHDVLTYMGAMFAGGLASQYFATTRLGAVMWFFAPMMFIVGFIGYVVLTRRDVISQNIVFDKKPV